MAKKSIKKTSAVYKKRFPKYAEDIDSVSSLIERLGHRRLYRVNPAGRPPTPKVVWNLQCYVQLALHRVIDLSTEICNAWNSKKPVIAIILVRAMMENCAYLYDIALKVRMYIKNNDFQSIHDLIVNRMMGSRTIKGLQESVNVMTVIDKVDKTFEGFKDHYEFLCDFCHPNYSGMHGLYGKINRENIYFNLNRDFGMTEEVFIFILIGLLPGLQIFEESMNQIEEVYPEITKLSNEEAAKSKSGEA